MRKLPFALALLLLLLSNNVVLAQDDDGEEEGRDFLELSIFGGGAIPVGDLSDWGDTLTPETGFDIGFDVGAFVTSNMVVGVTFTYSQFTIETSSPASSLHHRFFNPSLYLKRYFFNDGNLAPFLKIHAGVDIPKFTTFVQDRNGVTPGKFRELSYDPAFSFGGSAGLFYYTSDFSGLFIEGAYNYGLTDDTDGEFQGTKHPFGVKTGIVGINAGIVMFFGSSE